MKGPYWTNRLYRPEDTDAVMALIRAVHGEGRPGLNQAYWEWRYLNGTEFQADILLAEHEGRPIGIQPVALFACQWGPQRLKGAMYTGVLTHPDHRRRGVFRSLIESSNAFAAERGAQFSMTMPNDASIPGFLRFGDWQYPGLIPLYLKVTDGAALLRPRTGRAFARASGWLPALVFRRRRRSWVDPRLEIEPGALAPPELDAVFEEFCAQAGTLMLRRTAAYWNWRYAARPEAVYHTLLARHGGRLAGAVVTAIERRMGVQVGLVLDVLARGEGAVLRGLLRAAEHHLTSQGIGLVTCQATTPMLQQALVEEGFTRPNPRRLPKRFHYVFRPTGVAGLPRIPEAMSDWHLTMGDSDNA